MAASPAVYWCRSLVKRREAKGSGFELRVPELRIRPGEVVVLRGASGCGKSTLLDLLALALKPDGAETFNFRPEHQGSADLLHLWGRGDLDGLGRLRAANIGYVLQTGGLLPFLTARENIALSCRLLGRDPGGAIERLSERLGILHLLDRSPGQLSLGERQRVAIARAMAHRPSVVLADEPTASVDPVNAAAILDLLLELVRQAGVTAVIASHDWQPEAIPGIQVLGHRIERDGATTRSLFWS
ncbi:MAG: ABC transporter ATP-binding protein [Bdellovibrio bacteriovorus]